MKVLAISNVFILVQIIYSFHRARYIYRKEKAKKRICELICKNRLFLHNSENPEIRKHNLSGHTWYWWSSGIYSKTHGISSQCSFVYLRDKCREGWWYARR